MLMLIAHVAVNVDTDVDSMFLLNLILMLISPAAPLSPTHLIFMFMLILMLPSLLPFQFRGFDVDIIVLFQLHLLCFLCLC